MINDIIVALLEKKASNNKLKLDKTIWVLIHAQIYTHTHTHTHRHTHTNTHTHTHTHTHNIYIHTQHTHIIFI